MKTRMKLAVGLLALTVIVTSAAISGTMAKYTTKVGPISSSARVARFEVGFGKGPEAQQTSLDLFQTIQDDNPNLQYQAALEGLEAMGLGNGIPKEKDVWNQENDGTPVIAPGTSGTTYVDVFNASEVTVKWKLEIEVINEAGIPLCFSTNNGLTWEEISGTKILSLSPGGTLGKNKTTDSQKIRWKWMYEDGNDEKDTELGMQATWEEVAVTVNVRAIFTQVD